MREMLHKPMPPELEAMLAPVIPDLRGTPFNFELKPVSLSVSLDRILAEENAERQARRALMEKLLLKSLENPEIFG